MTTIITEHFSGLRGQADWEQAKIKTLSPQFSGSLAMLTATFFWGSSYWFMQKCLSELSAGGLIVWRFGLAAVVVGVILGPGLRQMTLAELRHGVISGAVLGAAFYAVMTGLKYTTTGNAGFLLGSTSVMVPLWGAIFGGKYRWGLLGAALLSFGGIGLLSYAGDGRTQPGDWLCLLSAGLYSGYFILSDRYLRQERVEYLVFGQFLGAVLVGGLSVLLETPDYWPQSAQVWWELAYLSGFCSVAGFGLQMYAQKRLSSGYASIIYAAEPVFALLIGITVLQEPWSWRSLSGAGLILLGIVLAAQSDRRSATR